MKKVVDTRYAKSTEYGQVIRKIARKGRCPFCPKNFKYHSKPILRRSGTWLITENGWPYKNALHHFVIINTLHKEKVEELTGRDFATILKLIQWACREFKILGGAMAMRFGETSHTGATVCHLHCHLIVPKLNRRTQLAKVVRFPIG